MSTLHPLIPMALAVVLALTACSGSSDDATESNSQTAPELCPSARNADDVVDFWASEEWEKLESRLRKLASEDGDATPCTGREELINFYNTIGAASGYARNPSDAERTEATTPDAISEKALQQWLTAIDRDDVDPAERKQAASGFTDSSNDEDAVRAGRDKIDFAVGECTGGWLCDIRDFYDDDDPSNGVIVMETQYDDTPAFTGEDKKQRKELTDWVDTWKPKFLKEIKVFYYADKNPGDEPADTPPYATIKMD